MLGRLYAAALVDSGVQHDVIFGPAYKGIPIAVATAMALAEFFDKDVPYCFNRKEAKDHGEGGNLVGHPLSVCGPALTLLPELLREGFRRLLRAGTTHKGFSQGRQGGASSGYEDVEPTTTLRTRAMGPASVGLLPETIAKQSWRQGGTLAEREAERRAAS